MARMMDRMMVDSMQPFGFARMTTRRNQDSRGGEKPPPPPRNGLKSEKSETRRERAKQGPDIHAVNGTRHPPTQGDLLDILINW